MSAPAVNEPITIHRIVGNREAIGGQLLDNNGAAINVTGKTIKFRMVNLSTDAVKVNNATATIDTAASGLVSYTPAAIDVDTAGRYACWFIDDDTIDRIWPYDGPRLVLKIKSETDES